jgi:hypothetical protein
MRYFAIILFSLCFYGCQKDRLGDDASILEGRWRFLIGKTSYTDLYLNEEVYSSPLGEMNDKVIELEFEKSGKLKFYSDGKLNEKARFRIDKIESYDDHYQYHVIIDRHLKWVIKDYFKMGNDTIIVYGFPFLAVAKPGCGSCSVNGFGSFFTRVSQ